MIKFVICVDSTPIKISDIRSFRVRKSNASGRYHVYALLESLVMLDVVSFGVEVCAVEAANILTAIKNDPTRYRDHNRVLFDCATDFFGCL